MGDASDIPFRVELVRKANHLCSLSIPILYYSFSKSTALAVLIPLTAAFLLMDILRYHHEPTAKLFYKLFGWILRAHERGGKKVRFNGATYMLLSATICILIFPKFIVITSFAILIISDGAAALIGNRFGRHKISIGRKVEKSLEGSVAFFLSSIAVVLVTPKVAHLPEEYLIGVAAAFIGMLAEAFSTDIIDDNLAVPISTGATMWGLYLLFSPGLNIYHLDG